MTTPILGPSSTTALQAATWAAKKGAPNPWAEQAFGCYSVAERLGIRGEVMWAMACKETGYGKFGRAVTPEHHNPGGIKIPDPSALGLPDNSPDAHQRQPSWELGWRMMGEHLALYAGVPGYPLAYTRHSPTRWSGATADPRHFGILFGTVRDVEDLGGEDPPDGVPDWNANPGYGVSIVKDYLDPLVWWVASGWAAL